jgi:hypothetical protein
MAISFFFFVFMQQKSFIILLQHEGRDCSTFSQTVFNKLNWAAHGHTADEIVFQRTNTQLPFMG